MTFANKGSHLGVLFLILFFFLFFQKSKNKLLKPKRLQCATSAKSTEKIQLKNKLYFTDIIKTSKRKHELLLLQKQQGEGRPPTY